MLTRATVAVLCFTLQLEWCNAELNAGGTGDKPEQLLEHHKYCEVIVKFAFDERFILRDVVSDVLSLLVLKAEFNLR